MVDSSKLDFLFKRKKKLVVNITHWEKPKPARMIIWNDIPAYSTVDELTKRNHA